MLYIYVAVLVILEFLWIPFLLRFNIFSISFRLCYCWKGCEREVAEAAKGDSEELKSESIMRLSWALVHSRQDVDVQRGIAMLEGQLVIPLSIPDGFFSVISHVNVFLFFIAFGLFLICGHVNVNVCNWNKVILVQYCQIFLNSLMFIFI